MFDTFLVTTSSEGLQPLGTAAQRSFELITGTLSARLGDEHARLFAEPVATEHGDRIDWHAPMPGAATPLPDLTEDDQRALHDRLGRLVADIREEADRLAASADAQDQRLSEALANAIEIPDEAMIYALRDPDGVLHPVLVHWAWLQDGQKSVRGLLTAMVPRPQPAPVVATGADAGSRAAATLPWWWLILLGWLLLAVLLAYVLYLLIAPCGLNGVRPVYCPAPAPPVSAIPGERAVIEDEIAALQHELALRDRACQPTIPVLPAQPAAPETPAKPAPKKTPAPPDKAKDKADLAPKATARRLVDRGGKRGALNFVLAWSTIDDIDLAVTCPAGQTVSYRNRGDCNGNYDLDANVKRAEAVTDPVENIVFGPAVPGLYKVRVHLKSERTAGEKAVTLHVMRQDGRTQSYSGTVSGKTPEWSLNISISR
ncbi:hypothetical protein ACFMPD_03950 [Sedimentitalea sp. HM32M-2]|uniref:hypothetical protein n=1 Tax=Sedimentitalea sp. HM32M-2 TaxID=3351566 RepID=UPI0036269BB5